MLAVVPSLEADAFELLDFGCLYFPWVTGSFVLLNPWCMGCSIFLVLQRAILIATVNTYIWEFVVRVVSKFNRCQTWHVLSHNGSILCHLQWPALLVEWRSTGILDKNHLGHGCTSTSGCKRSGEYTTRGLSHWQHTTIIIAFVLTRMSLFSWSRHSTKVQTKYVILHVILLSKSCTWSVMWGW